MMGQLAARGHQLTSQPDQADVLVVNTCSFIDPAKQESIDTILEMAREKEQGRARRLVVTGCLTQRYDAELRREIPEIDANLGTGQVRPHRGLESSLEVDLPGAARAVDQVPFHRLAIDSRQLAIDVRLNRGAEIRAAHEAPPFPFPWSRRRR